MAFTTDDIYKFALETTQRQFDNLIFTFTEPEMREFKSLTFLGDSENVALWTVIAERYKGSDGADEIYKRAYEN